MLASARNFCLGGLILFPSLALAQAIPSQPPPSPVDNEQVIGYWTTETGWQSELQLRNNLIGQELTVTPALRLADGTETTLAAVTIKPQEVISVDLEAAIGSAAPQLVGAYGSIVLRYHSMASRNLYAALMLHNIEHPFAIHIDATWEAQDLHAGGREGVWWLPKETTSDYLILTNLGKDIIPVNLSIYDSTGKEARQQFRLGPRETVRYSMRKLVTGAGLTGLYGGIKVSPTAHAGSLDSLHFIFDETAGFSSVLKMFEHDFNATLEERDSAKTEGVWTLRAPMLALSNPDAALAFPPGTTLQPQLFIHNTTAHIQDAALRFRWRAGTRSGTVTVPSLYLIPFETRRVDVGLLQRQGVIPKEANWSSVTLKTSGTPDEVMAVAASYDETLRYGAQTPFSDQLAPKWEGGMWEFDAYHDSIITAGNGGPKQTQAAFTIFYHQGADKYELEQTLQPDEQMWIDVGKLIREHVVDKNGKVLPVDLTSGSYEFRDLTDIGIGNLFEGKVIYDKTNGHVAYGCAICCGFSEPHVAYSPLGIPMSATAGQDVLATDVCGGQTTSVGSYFYANWNTTNTGIATVDYYGTHTGVGVGSTLSRTNGYLKNGTGQKQKTCPTARSFPTGNVNVGPYKVEPISTTVQGAALCPSGQQGWSRTVQNQLQ